MTKLDLQKELLERVKEGVKPSDLKKSNKEIRNPDKNISKNPYKTHSKDDEGYSSEEEKIPTAPALPNQQLKNLQSQVSSLKKQLQTYKDFKEADLKIKEKYKEKIKELEAKIKEREEIIGELKKQVKNQTKTPIKTFSCYHCKNKQELPLLVLELPEGKLCQPCWQVLRKKTKEQANPTLNTPQLFTCVACEIEKQETPIYKKVEISYKPHLIKGKEYPVCSTCSPHVKEYNQDENRELDIDE